MRTYDAPPAIAADAWETVAVLAGLVSAPLNRAVRRQASATIQKELHKG